MALALPVAARAANDWVPLAGISATTTLVTNSLCYTDGTDLVCDGSAGLAGSVASTDRIVSDTSAITVQSSGVISITTNGSTANYFDTAGRLVTAGISVTTVNGISSTNGYFSSRVGVGTSSPSRTLHLVGSSPILQLTDTDTGANNLISADSAAGNIGIIADQGNTVSNSNILFYVDSNEWMRITSAGYTGIGINTPASALHVSGTVRATQYCDIDGANCSASPSGGGASTFAALTDVSVSLVGTSLYGPGSLNGAVAGYTANTAYGVNSLSSTLLAGGGNSGFGASALRSIRGGSVNTAAGYNSLYSLTSGSNNTAVGGDALYSVTAGGYNSAVGRYTLYSNTGEYNSALGANALRNKTSGNYNTAAGYYAGYGVGGISYGNAFFGAYAGQGIGTGGSNTLVGYNAGGGISTGSANIVLGADTSPYSNTGSYQLNIGNALWGDIGSGLGYANKIGINIASPTTNFGVSGTTYLSGRTGIGATPNASYMLYVGGDAYSTGTWGTSDARFKDNVQTLGGLLAKVDHLRPVTFTWKKDSFAAKGNPGEQIGVIAQEVEAVFPDLVKTGADGYKAVAYDKLSVLLLGAVKELKAENDSLKAHNAELDARVKALECKILPDKC